MSRIIPKPTQNGGGGGAPLSDAIPQPLGIASAGTSTEASRADHVHETPALSDLQDVSLGTVNDGDVLTYSNATSEWISAPASGAVEPFILIALGII
jgi:hypothetical protein